MPALQLENQKTMFKQSYVRLDHVYDAPFSVLRSYSPNGRAYHWRLDINSYCRLAALLALEPEVYPPTNNLWETATTRLQQLANPTLVQDQGPGLSFQHSVATERIPSPAPTSAAPSDVLTEYIPPTASQQQRPRTPDIWSQTDESRDSTMYPNYGPIRQLPMPTTYTPRRQGGCCSFATMFSFVFGLPMIYAGWRIYRAFSQSG